MKILYTWAYIFFSVSSFAGEVFYQIEANDQLGSLSLSLGHKKVWTKRGAVSMFKKRSEIENADSIYPGFYLKLDEDDILFKKNVEVLNNKVLFKKKIFTLEEYDYLLSQESFVQNDSVDASATYEISEPDNSNLQSIKTISLTVPFLELCLGIGTFTAFNNEVDRTVKTSTFSGIQPLFQFKGIYSLESVGSISADLLAKKIINDKFSFPINIDYRIQLVPKWNYNGSFKFALSHSLLRHSYIGKSSNMEIAYKLESSFIGAGLVIPADDFWFEFYIEKAYSGKAKSSESTKKVNSGIRFDSELIYSLTKKLKIIPGINYYQFKLPSERYQFSVYEARLVLAREFEF